MKKKQEEREDVQPRSKGGVGYKGRGTRGKGRGTEGNVIGTAGKGEGQEARKRDKTLWRRGRRKERRYSSEVRCAEEG